MRIIRRIARRLNWSLRGLRRLLNSPRACAFVGLVFFCALLGLALTGSRAAYLDQLGARADICAAVFVMALTAGLYAALSGHLVSFVRRRSLMAAYDERNIIFDLGQAARAATSIDQLYKIVVDRLGEALGVDRVALFVAEPVTGNYVCRVITGSEPQPFMVTLARDAFVIKRVRNLSTPFGFGPEDLATWERAFGAAHADLSEARRRECAALREVDARLLLQITIKDQLVGLLSLGPRCGERNFSAADRRMLMSVAAQLAFVIENGKLVERMVKDERLTRELALAGDVQQQLFPAAAPQSLFIDLAGFCQPAREVGGDYYDFLRFDHGHVGVAIADVAGKGISAALLMSSLQASLRSYTTTQSEAMRLPGAVAQLTTSLNRLMCRSTGPSSYVTFFYAQFDEETQHLTYVNAGHNPPFVVRASEPDDLADITSSFTHGRAARLACAGAVAVEEAASEPRAPQKNDRCTIFELTVGGPVIGVFQDCAYQQETVQLRSGDLLFAFTDGVTEALNAAGVEFGDGRLRETVCDVAHLPAEEVRDAVVRRVREWRGDAPAHDDLTFVVLKAK